MTLYVDELLQEVMQKHREIIEQGNSEDGEGALEWVEAKDISIDSLKKVMGEFSDEATNEVFEHIMGGILDMDHVHQIFFTCIGISFELGYTAAEKQLDSKFDL